MFFNSQVIIGTDCVIKSGLGRHEVEAQIALAFMTPTVYYCDEHTVVMERIKGASFEEAAITTEALTALGRAIALMHMQGWAHNDLKLEHIYFINGSVKLIDFELACPLARYKFMADNDLVVLKAAFNNELLWSTFLKAYQD